MLALALVATCKRTATRDGQAATETQTQPASIVAGDAGSGESPGAVAPTSVNPLIALRMAEVQAIVDAGAEPGRLAALISGYAAEPEALFARKTALTILRTVPSRADRLQALIEAGGATSVAAADDPLWPELVGTLSETWATENSAAGRRRMLHEKNLRTRLLLVSSLARYAASNRGLSELTMGERGVLRAEFMRLYSALPPAQRREVDAFVARINVNARGTL